MTQNIDLNNVAKAVAVETKAVEKKEEKNMVLAITFEELKVKTVKELRVAAQSVEIKGYSKMKKDELLEALKPFCTAHVSLNEYYESKGAVDPKKANGERLVKLMIITWVYQTANNYTYAKDGKTYSLKPLFFKATKNRYADRWIAKYDRLFAVTGSCISQLFGAKANTPSTVKRAYEKMQEYGFCSLDKDVQGRYTVYMTDDQKNRMVAQYKTFVENAKTTGAKSLTEYVTR